MSKFKLIATNLVTAVAVATLTSLFWMALYASNGDSRVEAAGDSKVVGKSRVAIAEGLVVGPAGLAIPVAGVKAAQLADTYSQARAGGARVHDAIDIMAARGTPVVAAGPGRVEKLYFSEGGGGISAYVRSPDRRWTYYYAHLDAYAPGRRAGPTNARGAPIGTGGTTREDSPDGPHLHFAIHRMAPGEKWHQGSAVNPYPLLAGKGR